MERLSATHILLPKGRKSCKALSKTYPFYTKTILFCSQRIGLNKKWSADQHLSATYILLPKGRKSCKARAESCPAFAVLCQERMLRAILHKLTRRPHCCFGSGGCGLESRLTLFFFPLVPRLCSKDGLVFVRARVTNTFLGRWLWSFLRLVKPIGSI